MKSYLRISIKVFIISAVVIGLIANLMTFEAKTKIMLLDMSFVLFTGAILRMLWIQEGLNRKSER